MLRLRERNSKRKDLCSKNTYKNLGCSFSKLVKTKTNSKCLIGKKIDKATRPLVFIIAKMCGYVKAFKVEGKNNKLMSFHIYDKKLLEKYKAIWNNIKDL